MDKETIAVALSNVALQLRDLVYSDEKLDWSDADWYLELAERCDAGANSLQMEIENVPE